jgi:Icc-related predicted phosphoesterase
MVLSPYPPAQAQHPTSAHPRFQTSGVEVTADDLRELQKPYVAAVAGNQDVQDIKDRWGFNAQELMKMKDLKVEAVTFMRVGGTLKSGAETTGMMMQGAVNKVSPLL